MNLKRALLAAAGFAALTLSPANATEPGSFGNSLFAPTVGVTLAAAPPPGLFFNNTFYYLPMATGNGNTGCGPGCDARYQGAADIMTLTWSTGLTFLGGTYFPTISGVGYGATVTTTPYPPGGGPGASPIYGNTLFLQVGNVYVNPINFSWKIGDMPLFVGAGLGFVAPSGTTYPGSLMPDYWTVRPHAAITYLGNDLNLTASFIYDVNTASRGNTGLYQTIAQTPGTPPATASFLTGPANPGRGYTSGDTLFVDLTATKRFQKWEVGPIGFVKIQMTDDSPGGLNPGTGSAWTCAQLTAAKLPSCGKDLNLGAGMLLGYNFGPVDMKLMYMNAFYSRDAIGAPTGSTVILKTSFRLWAPDEAPSPKKAMYTKN